tara:strand:- start:219 stop:878 length:660 start_codon:yes stop_codon:yes gene_type:complete
MHSTHRFTREEINEMLRNSPNAVERAIIRLFTMQNQDEQRFATTNSKNDRGFCAADARAGTRFARWLQGMDNKNVKRYQPKSLSHYKAERIFARYTQDGGTVLDRARKIALKHSQQLVDYANAEADRIDAETDKRLAALEAKIAARKEQLEREKKYGKPVQSDVWYQNGSPAGECKGDGGSLSKPPPGSWAATARMMAQNDDSGFDWDRWKDEMKERDM